MNWVSQFGSRALGEELQVLATHEWGNSSIHLLGSDDQPRIVVKVGRRWTASAARALHDDAVTLWRRLPSVSQRTRVPEPLAWLAEPPAICMRWVAGQDAWCVLRDELARPSASRRIEVCVAVVDAWGRALADYHLAATESADASEAAVYVEKIVRRVGLSWRRVQKIPGWRTIARAYHDVGLHNLRIGDDGTRFWLDLPEHRIVRPIHSDVANAVAWLDDALRDAPRFARRELRRVLVGALLRAYGEAGPCAFESDADVWWLRLFEAWAQLSWVRTALMRRHHVQVAESAARAIKNRLGLIRLPAGSY